MSLVFDAEEGLGDVVNEELMMPPNEVVTPREPASRFSLRDGGRRISEEVNKGIVNIDSLSSDGLDEDDDT
jgi:hypothetical protein